MELTDFPTIRELLALPVFAGSKVLGGEESLDRPVGGVSLTDIPDYYNWVYPHELLVSTCYAIRNDSAAIASLIPTLAQKGLSGACIKASRFLGAMPEVMVAAADRLSFPLIELPADVRFADITKAIFDERLRRQTSLLRSSLSVNQMLIQTITTGASLEQIVQMVCEITGGTVLLVDSVNRRQACSLSPGDARFRNLDGDALRQAILAEADVYEMELDGHSFGALYLCQASGRPPAGSEMLSQILQAIPLEISREHSVREREEARFLEFFLHLVSDRIIDAAWEQNRADAFGLHLAGQHTLLRLHIEPAADMGRYAVIFQRTAFFQTLRQALEALPASLHIMSQGGDDLILLTAAEPEEPLTLEGLSNLFEQLGRDYPALVLSGGCSRSHAGISGLSQCSWEAQLSLNTARSKSGSCFLRFDQLGILRLLYANDPHQEIKTFIRDVLKKLALPETPHREELLETLACYFRCLGNQRRMAQELYVHYNTVSYRLKSIQSLLEADLSDPGTRLQLELALYLQSSI